MENWVCLNLIKKDIPVNMHNLLEAFNYNPREILAAKLTELRGIKGIGPSAAEKILALKNTDIAKGEIESARKKGFTIITIMDKIYPDILRNIHNPPIVLYIKGRLLPSDKNSIAIVGSRNASPYGLSTAQWLGEQLAEAGLTIVSGMARGIDSAAHSGALKADGGRTMAVLGSGIDVIYPPENKTLYKKIAENGAVISELPLGTPPNAWNFPARNRIISGLSMGTVVVEASQRSGSLITASVAIEQGREVFAVPGSIKSSTSKGTNQLIKDGAKLVEDLEDILEELPVELEKKSKEKIQYQANEAENKIIKCLKEKEMIPEEIIDKTGLKPEEINSLLLLLELKGIVKRVSGNYYFLN